MVEMDSNLVPNDLLHEWLYVLRQKVIQRPLSAGLITGLQEGA
jgi:hypothetical protein